MNVTPRIPLQRNRRPPRGGGRREFVPPTGGRIFRWGGQIALILCAQSAWAGADYGILLLAHGGNAAWNREIAAVRAGLEAQAPTETALGMADSREIQAALERLEARGVGRVVAVPLFVHSASEVLDHTRYILGLSEKPSATLRTALAALHAAGGARGGGHAHHRYSEARARTRLPLSLTAAFDDHPLVAEILLERARALSREPALESLILVGHGPVDDAANRAWLKTMGNLAEGLKERGGFAEVLAATLRDDSPSAVKAGAVERLRAMARRAARAGRRVLVVPHLVARGGIEGHIVVALKGLDYAWEGRTLCPHPNILRWASESAAMIKYEGGKGK